MSIDHDGGLRVTTDADNPILYSPYDVPSRYRVPGLKGPTDEILPGRPRSQSFSPDLAPKAVQSWDLSDSPDCLSRRPSTLPT